MLRPSDTGQTLGLEDTLVQRPSQGTLAGKTHVWRNISAFSTLKTPETPAILPTPLLERDSTSVGHNLSWYDWWIYSVLSEAKTEGAILWMNVFIAVWRGVCLEAAKPHSTVDAIVTSLVDQGLLCLKDDTRGRDHARILVFSIIGWQTMLYRPDTGSSPSSELVITNETSDYRGQAHWALRQSKTASKKSLHDFLMGFGVMLPCHKKVFRKLESISSASFNAQLLVKVGGLDVDERVLYLFRHPSFCVIHRPSGNTRPANTTLHSCAAAPGVSSHWATSEDVDHLLGEILLSYRLLFGQNKASRHLFRTMRPFEDAHEEGKDDSLADICGKKNPHSTIHLYFPVLRSRIAVLERFLSTKRPRTWKEIWNDKRDSASWLTFWAVLVIVILQIVQIGLQAKQG
ncbi:hypothetical protein BCR34DRAFT_628441 [Clohesyomyces aquaticus]|uniref:Uncharacterized protein n=1 Tax=Clohesyomyces aquaticus TaxID=1231657 RepID=A0A1Y1YJJ5_9PLEO|nr:hypothetical protein BCR34DRAFT_628441 [Clohesyomyces aquaticus]